MPPNPTAESAGVALIADLLARLAAHDGFDAATFARQTGAARSTVYDAVTRLETAGFVERDSRGGLMPGVNAGRLGFASFRLATILPAAEALLPALRDEVDATASLVSVTNDAEVVLMRRSARWDKSGGGRELEASIAANVYLRLRLRSRASEPERRFARACLERIAAALQTAIEHQSTHVRSALPCAR